MAAITPTGRRRSDIARSLRVLAARALDSHPAAGTPGHLRDAARSLDHGNTEAAKRHLRAAMNVLSPLSLYRHGVTDDEGHTAARQHITAAHRAYLQVQEVEDTEQRNRALRAQSRAAAAPQDGQIPARPIPGRAQDLSWDWDDVLRVIDLVGPHGYVHGWKYVGVPGKFGLGRMAKQYNGHALEVRPNHYRHSSPNWSAFVDGQKVDTRTDQESAMQAAHESADKGGLPSATMVHAAQRNQMLPTSLKGLQRQNRVARSAHFSWDWDDVLRVIDMSAKTGMLAVTPHPLGRPGGPGLWHVKGMELPPYVQNIAHALLRTGRAKTTGQAVAMARAATKRWLRGGGGVHPEVRAAAAASDAEWRAKQARARAAR